MMSRRDWFRLVHDRAHSDTQSTGATVEDHKHGMGHAQHTLRPVAHPQNHGGINLTELPPLREGLLSEDQVQQLFADIESLASDIQLMQRWPDAQRASALAFTTMELLRTAQRHLLSGAIPRIQIRYHWQAVNWIDTLERRDAGIRLVRIRHSPSADTGVIRQSAGLPGQSDQPPRNAEL